jgi:hypothetical protein
LITAKSHPALSHATARNHTWPRTKGRVGCGTVRPFAPSGTHMRRGKGKGRFSNTNILRSALTSNCTDLQSASSGLDCLQSFARPCNHTAKTGDCSDPKTWYRQLACNVFNYFTACCIVNVHSLPEGGGKLRVSIDTSSLGSSGFEQERVMLRQPPVKALNATRLASTQRSVVCWFSTKGDLDAILSLSLYTSSIGIWGRIDNIPQSRLDEFAEKFPSIAPWYTQSNSLPFHNQQEESQLR